MAYSPEEALAAGKGKPPSGPPSSLSPEEALKRASRAAPVSASPAAKSSRLPILDMSGGLSKALKSGGENLDLKPAIDRALSWVSDTLDQTEYGRTYKAEVASG